MKGSSITQVEVKKNTKKENEVIIRPRIMHGDGHEICTSLACGTDGLFLRTIEYTQKDTFKL